MQRKQLRFRREGAALRPPLFAYLSYLLLCSLLLTGLSFARYVAQAEEQKANLSAAGFSVQAEAEMESPSYTWNGGGRKAEYSFTVSNNGQVAVAYDVEVAFDQPLPEGISVTLDSQTGSLSADGKTVLFSAGPLLKGNSNRHTLTVAAEESASLMAQTLKANVSIQARQTQ